MHVKEAIGLIQAPRPQDDPIGFQAMDTVPPEPHAESNLVQVELRRVGDTPRPSAAAQPSLPPRLGWLFPSHRVTPPTA